MIYRLKMYKKYVQKKITIRKKKSTEFPINIGKDGHFDYLTESCQIGNIKSFSTNQTFFKLQKQEVPKVNCDTQLYSTRGNLK